MNAILTRITARPFLLIVLVSIAVTLPAFLPTVLLHGHDSRFHILWQHHFADQLWRGSWYPRWLPGMNDGFGSPTFFLYPPLAHLVAAAFQPFLPDPSLVPARLAIAIALSLVVGSIGMLL